MLANMIFWKTLWWGQTHKSQRLYGCPSGEEIAAFDRRLKKLRSEGAPRSRPHLKLVK